MDGYQFTASIIGSVVSLAWPLAILICVWLFREKLNELLPLLRMKYKDFDVSFRLQEAEREAALLSPSPENAATNPTPEENDKFEKIAALSPKAAILEVRSDIEEALRATAERLDMSSTRAQSSLALMRLMRSHDIIDSQTSALLDDLRAIGNNAAHRSDANFTKEDALRFRLLANQAIARLQAAHL